MNLLPIWLYTAFVYIFPWIKNNPMSETPDDLIRELDSLETGEAASKRLIKCGPTAIGPLRKFLMEGKPSKIFQPRLWAIRALAGFRAKNILLDYLFQEKNISDPQERFGEEAVESQAARLLAAWPDDEMFRSLLALSSRRMLNGLIETLAEYRNQQTIAYFEQALEDDFYRAAAEKAFLKLGKIACDALTNAAVTPRPDASSDSPSSLKRRRSAAGLLKAIGTDTTHWQTLRGLIYEQDAELVVAAANLALNLASKKDRTIISRLLIALISSAPWHLREDVENALVAMKDESEQMIDEEIATKMKQGEIARSRDARLHILLKVRHRMG